MAFYTYYNIFCYFMKHLIYNALYIMQQLSSHCFNIK